MTKPNSIYLHSPKRKHLILITISIYILFYSSLFRDYKVERYSFAYYQSLCGTTALYLFILDLFCTSTEAELTPHRCRTSIVDQPFKFHGFLDDTPLQTSLILEFPIHLEKLVVGCSSVICSRRHAILVHIPFPEKCSSFGRHHRDFFTALVSRSFVRFVSRLLCFPKTYISIFLFRFEMNHWF